MDKINVLAAALFAVTIGCFVMSCNTEPSVIKTNECNSSMQSVEVTIYTTESVRCTEFVATESEETEEVTSEETTIADSTEVESIPIYSVNGYIMPVEWQEHLYRQLDRYGIAYWMPIAICQAYQESGFDADQVTNGIDMGLYQYREPYFREWEDRAYVESGDIFDPYHQIDVYTSMVSQWLSEGQTESWVISNHNTGGWGDYSQSYVDQVAQHFDTVYRIN